MADVHGVQSIERALDIIEAVAANKNSSVLTEVRPYIAQITAKFGLTSHLGILEGDKVVYIEKMDIFSNIKLYSQIGLRMHAYCSSLGKCLLANFSNTQLRSIMGRTEFMRFTPNTITTIESKPPRRFLKIWATCRKTALIKKVHKANLYPAAYFAAFIKKAPADFIRKCLSEFL